MKQATTLYLALSQHANNNKIVVRPHYPADPVMAQTGFKPETVVRLFREELRPTEAIEYTRINGVFGKEYHITVNPVENIKPLIPRIRGKLSEPFVAYRQSMAEVFDVKGTKPISLEIGSEMLTVKSWHELSIATLNYLQSQHPVQLNKYLTQNFNDFKALKDSSGSIISTKPLSATAIVLLLYNLFAQLGYNCSAIKLNYKSA